MGEQPVSLRAGTPTDTCLPETTGGTRVRRLSGTAFEKVVEAHKARLGKLTDGERRQTEAYYRVLRDLR